MDWAGSHFQIGKALPMDRFIYRLLTYLAIVLVVVYVWQHSESIVIAIRHGVNDWWH
jgi:hypothetical protein